MLRQRLLLAAALALGVARGAPAGAAGFPAGRPGRPARPPVVVTIVVDQLAAWIAAERLPLLPPTGGFHRLLAEGAYLADMRYAHAVTETAPGHAALYTGLPPHRSGIYANERRPLAECTTAEERARPNARSSVLADPAARPIVAGTGGVAGECGASLAALRADTLADRLRAAEPGALVVSLSLKDRGALFGGGRHPTASVWFDAGRGAFVTSSAVASALPAWIEPANREVAAAVARGAEWALEDAPWVAAHAGTPDEQAGEGAGYGGDERRGLAGIGGRFPHALRSAKSWRASPLADDLLLRTALAALDAEAPRARRTLLAISLSSNDAIGHLFGPDSWEAWDELHRLDAALGRFFAGLDERFGAAGWAVVLSGDHGVIHMPEACTAARVDRWARPCKSDGRRLMMDPPPPAGAGPTEVDLVEEARAVAARVPGGSRAWIEAIIDPYVYLGAAAKQPANRAALASALAAARLPGVKRFVDVTTLPAACPPPTDDSDDALVCRSVAPGAGGDLYVVGDAGSFFDPGYARGRGTNHGSPNLYDRAVPLLVRAPGRVPVGAIAGPRAFSAFAHTASALLGLVERDVPPGEDLTRAPR